ncbi:malate:quinone oxidoreductase, partial [Staphylococcus epidermidis]|uniref:malate:quinone oxidoreductase n=1 Tax=Staphylococcus epidermidis TaxID=1282 RepID=UPI001642F701
SVVGDYVFMGGGGGGIGVLEKTGMGESKDVGGLGMSGELLICRKGDVINEDEVKVYGKEGRGRARMSVADLDRGYMDGERRLLS